LTDRLRSVAQPWEVACFAFVPALVVGFTAWYELRDGKTLGDLPIFRAASQAVLHGRSPFAAASPRALAGFDTFVYPPAAAYLFSPLAVVPYTASKVLMVVLGVASVLVALKLLGVTDWRCYGVAAASAPVVDSIGVGAFSTFLLLGTAAAWRYRDRPAAGGLFASLTATTKLFLWPLALWLLARRRLRATLVFVSVTLVLVLGG
jgi:alpha-1,2-mannosyltransferase